MRDTSLCTCFQLAVELELGGFLLQKKEILENLSPPT